jgi:CheY-like chemotaxis protein
LQLPRLIVSVPPERLATRQEHTKRSLRAILVDDNADAVLTLSALLRHSGHDVRGVHSPADCLALLDTFQPDVCICDIGLPGMSGYELVRKLRAHPNTKDARLIAVSGYARKQDVVMSLESGFDVHMAKPVAFDELLREMQGEKAPHLDR